MLKLWTWFRENCLSRLLCANISRLTYILINVLILCYLSRLSWIGYEFSKLICWCMPYEKFFLSCLCGLQVYANVDFFVALLFLKCFESILVWVSSFCWLLLILRAYFPLVFISNQLCASFRVAIKRNDYISWGGWLKPAHWSRNISFDWSKLFLLHTHHFIFFLFCISYI